MKYHAGARDVEVPVRGLSHSMSLRDNMRSLASSPVDNSRPTRYEVAMEIGDNSNVAEEPFACGRVGTTST